MQAASASASASSPVDPFPEPPPPPLPANDTERDARLVDEIMISAWSQIGKHPVVLRLTDTEPMHRLDAACEHGDGAACTVAAAGYYHRNLLGFFSKRFTHGCDLGNGPACVMLLYGYGLTSGAIGAGFHFDVDVHPRTGETPQKAAVRRSDELCDAGLGPACYLATRFIEQDASTKGWRYARWVRGCALGSVEACRDMLQELAIGSFVAPADRPREIGRVHRLFRRVCASLAGSCVHLASLLQKPTETHRGLDLPELRAELLEKGCANKTDPTWDEAACAGDGGGP